LSHKGKKLLLEKNRKDLSIKRQCEILGISRGVAYYRPIVSEKDILLMKMIDKIYTRSPYYGKRRIRAELCQRNIPVGVKKVRTLMNKVGLSAIYPPPKTSISNSHHKKYPYLLKNLLIQNPDHVWSTDIAYVPFHKGFVYLTTIID
jgi:putative transposase